MELVREPENEYDDCAIALHLQGNKIAFIPSSVNEMLTHLKKNSQPRENVAIAVYFVQEVNKGLSAHASYLKRIEAPHYRTLSNKKDVGKKECKPTMDDLFDDSNRIINMECYSAGTKGSQSIF